MYPVWIAKSNPIKIAFNEKLRVLGYPHPVSMESFRLSNFGLVADILFWLCKQYILFFKILSHSSLSRFDKNMDIVLDTSSEQDRIVFLKSIAMFMVS